MRQVDDSESHRSVPLRQGTVMPGLLRQTYSGVGADRGEILLRVGSVKYQTELFREARGVRQVEVKSPQLTLLQAGAWPVLAFAPLRGEGAAPSTSWRRPEASARPNVSDVLPLLNGSIDGRILDLKAWIYDLEMDRDSGSKERSQKLRSDLFRLLNELVPETSIEFARVEGETRTVLVKTQDGEIPFHQLSQGILSMVGWVGTLIQRMYGVYTESEDPMQEQALVLVDEIDGHLHPDWQWKLIPAVNKVFPNLQVIATTHSPLVVGNLPVTGDDVPLDDVSLDDEDDTADLPTS